MQEYGTPLCVLGEAIMRSKCRQFVGTLGSHNLNARAAYASKAYIIPALARNLAEEGLDQDAVSGGELAVAMASEAPLERVYFHGNNKTPAELDEAVAAGMGSIAVDRFTEPDLLERVCAEAGKSQDILAVMGGGGIGGGDVVSSSECPLGRTARPV